MRKTYLFIVAVTMITASCKKQPTELNSVNAPVPEAQENNFSDPCYGNTWSAGGNLSAGAAFLKLVYNNKVYVFRSQDGSQPTGVHIFDGNSWQIIPTNIPVYANHPTAFGFTIGNKGYIGTANVANAPFYEYDFTTNTFTPKASYPKSSQFRMGLATFAVGNKGYVMGGRYSQNNQEYYSTDTYEYNPVNDSWTKKADFAWLGMAYGTGFTIGNKGYLLNGRIGNLYADFFREYNPATNTWISKTTFPGSPRAETNVFVISGYGYAGGGYSTSGPYVNFKDFYKYNPATDAWTQIPDFPYTGELHYTAFSINSRGYITYYDGWDGKLEKYTPKTCPGTGTSQ